jgi:hypothetical protein
MTHKSSSVWDDRKACRRFSQISKTVWLCGFISLASAAFSEAPSGTSIAQAEVVGITKTDSNQTKVEVRLRNPWTESVYVQICDQPPRLTRIAAHLEYRIENHWEVVPPTMKNAVEGDLPGQGFEIEPGAVVEFPFMLNSRSIRSRVGLRLVILARTKAGTMGEGLASPRFITNSFTVSARK